MKCDVEPPTGSTHDDGEEVNLAVELGSLPGLLGDEIVREDKL